MTKPLIDPSPLPYGLPEYARLTPEVLEEAIEVGLERERAQWRLIEQNTAPATISNTLEALEESGQELHRALAAAYSLIAAVGGPRLFELEEKYGPALAAHTDTLYLNQVIYERLIACRTEASGLGAEGDETRRLLERYITDFERSGIALPAAERTRVAQLNEQLAAAQTEFGQRVIRGMEAGALDVENSERLEGLNQQALENLKTPAGSYRLPLDLPGCQPLLSQLTDRAMRKELWLASQSRGSGSGADTDTRQLVLELADKRAQRAVALGYDNHAHYVIEQETAGKYGAVRQLLADLAPGVRRLADAELEKMLPRFQADHPGEEFAPWDWPYYEALVLREEYGVDEAALAPYFELNSVIERGVFWAANQVYGLSFEPRPELAGWAPEAAVWEVFDADGSPLALFVADYYRREGKSGGAWMDSLEDQNRLLGQRAVIINNMNIDKPAPGKPTLLAWDQVVTAFHEFGHALHGMLSDVHYPSFSGTSVPRDFVEYPSQFNEYWASHPRVLANYARHVDTGEPLGAQTAEKLRRASLWGKGFGTFETLAAASLDQYWHRVKPGEVGTDPEGVVKFESDALKDGGWDHDLIAPRYGSTFLNHSFGGGYDAGYYAYLWAEILAADTAQWCREDSSGEGGLNRQTGQLLRDRVLSRGDSRKPMDSFVALLGREPNTGPLLASKGLE